MKLSKILYISHFYTLTLLYILKSYNRKCTFSKLFVFQTYHLNQQPCCVRELVETANAFTSCLNTTVCLQLVLRFSFDSMLLHFSKELFLTFHWWFFIRKVSYWSFDYFCIFLLSLKLLDKIKFLLSNLYYTLHLRCFALINIICSAIYLPRRWGLVTGKSL